MNLRTILALDPSGSFYEGKGTTGWCLFDTMLMQPIRTGALYATDYTCMEEFWEAHIKLLESFAMPYMLVIEDYLLYGNKVDSQINSRMETPKLIGVLQHHCWLTHQSYYMQTASEVKTRWTDEILVHKGILVRTGRCFALSVNPKEVINRHCKDAVRHATHYAYFKNCK